MNDDVPSLNTTPSTSGETGIELRKRPAAPGVSKSKRPSLRPRTLLLGVVAALFALAAFAYSRGVQALEQRCIAAESQVHRMKDDASRILALRGVPQAALGKRRSNEELLATVEQALSAAGIARERWKDSVPQPLSRLAGTDYQRQVTQLYFDGLELRQLAAFLVELHGRDATLSVSGLALTTRNSSTGYDVETGLAYLVYAPREEGEGAGRRVPADGT